MIFPYIACSTAEPFILKRLSVTDDILGYEDEQPADRDAEGVLWARQHHAYGQGRPRFGHIHTPRQRHAAAALLCQVCGRDPDENDDGILWLLPGLYCFKSCRRVLDLRVVLMWRYGQDRFSCLSVFSTYS
ncbi:hypothetical protein [Nonomuraea dietziae]|uniref:hypothetical protein n=1 Tax=Nonomuraea dietziae TaxID=65515 RepID=UPI003449600A